MNSTREYNNESIKSLKDEDRVRLRPAVIFGSDGDVIYIDDDKRHIYDLNHKIRFVEVSEFPLANYRELIGFIYGIFSQNSDITKVFVDGIFKIVQSLGNEDLIKLVARLDSMSKAYNVDFVLAGNVDPAELPKEVEQYIRK